MILYMFEHCSLCFRVRMMAALKGVHLKEVVVEDDDTETMVKLVGRRVIPILVKDDGTPMLESMDMVDHIEAMGPAILVGPERAQVAALCDALLERTPPLTMVRYPLLPLPEFRTVAARDHFVVRKRTLFPDAEALRARTRELIADLAPTLAALDDLIETPGAVNGALSRDDICLVPLLRSAAVVEGLSFPPKVRDYFETMMALTGHRPLPRI